MEDKNNVFIMGDSYSTYEGYIPAGYHSYYRDERTANPIVKGVEKTWWKLLEKENNLHVVQNDSFSGSTICNTVRPELSKESSFVSRIDKYIHENFFTQNKVDTMLIFGGTNDCWINVPIGSVQYADWSTEDLKCALPAFCYLLDKAKKVVKNVIVIINSGLKEAVVEGFIKACEANQITYVCLKEIEKECGHPTERGMQQIAQQLANSLH